ncbi:immunoglobulin superfamily member [Conger conger]|uniref:immunoglobulin superfamily member n=1 Tax=Conger conger TaxID=82655 RepID=UPI002A5A7FC7|nr:immunoglobulin superfamily member [Conger conger]
MGPLSLSQSAQSLTHLLLATVIAGGLLSLCLVCDGATVQSVVTPVQATSDPLTAGPMTDGPEIALSTPEQSSNDSTPAVSEEEVEEEATGPMVEQHPPKEKAVEGEDVKFSCLLKDADPEGVVIHWIHQRSESVHTVLEGNQTSEDRFADRAFLCGDLGHGDFSMMLRNVSVEDRGVYLCVLTVSDGSTLQGSGTKLSIREDLGLQVMEESVGTIIGVTVAAVGVAIGLVALLLTQFRDKLNCLQK